MADERTILLKVELDVDQLKKAQKEAADKVDILKEKRKELLASTEKDTVAIAENAYELRAANKDLSDTTKAIINTQKAQEKNTGSLVEMREQLSAAKYAYSQLSEEVRSSSIGEQARQDIENLNAALKDLEGAYGDNQRKVGDYEGAIESVLAKNRDLAATFEDVYGEGAKPLSARLGELEDRMYEVALASGTDSEEFQAMRVEAAKLREVIIKVDSSVDQLAETGGALGGALQLGEGVVQSYSAAVGATALFGNENERVLEILTKLQGAQAVLQSLEAARTALQKNAVNITQLQAKAQNLLNLALGNGTGAAKAFRGALVATGIGALVVGVALLVENFDTLKGLFIDVNEAAQQNAETMHSAAEAVSNELSAADKLAKTLKDETISRQDKNKAIRKLQEEYPTLLSNIDAESASLRDVNKALALNTKLLFLKAQQEAVAEARAEKFKNIINAQVDAQTGQNVGLMDQIQAIGLNVDAQELANSKSYTTIKTNKEQIAVLDKLDKQLQAQIDTLMKEGATNEDINKVKERQKKVYQDAGKAKEEEAKKALELANKIKELELGNQQLSLDNQRKALEAHYKFLETLAGDHTETLLKLEEDKNRDLSVLEEKEKAEAIKVIESKYEEEVKAAGESNELIEELKTRKGLDILAAETQINAQRAQREIEHIAKVSEIQEQKVDATRKANNEIALLEKQLNLDIAKEGTTERLNAWKELQSERVRQVELARDEELRNADLTAAERVAIERKAELDILAIKKESYEQEKALNDQKRQDNLSLTASLLSSAQSLSDTLYQISANQIQKELNDVANKYNAQSQLLQDQLDAELITQAEYDAKKSELDAQSKAKEKKLKKEQFEKNKTAQLISAAINTAVGVTTALGAGPGVGFVMAAIAAALGAAQIALIASQPTPEFAAGGAVPLKSGLFGGDLHTNGGTKGIFEDGTRVEVEKDEAFFILNRSASRAIRSLSNLNQMHGGAPLMANGGVLKFASGGSFAASVSRSVEDRYTQQNNLIQSIAGMPNPVVLVEDINSAQGNYTEVRNRATF